MRKLLAYCGALAIACIGGLSLQTNAYSSSPSPQQNQHNLILAQIHSLQPTTDRPIVAIAHANDGSNRLFLSEKLGRIWLLDDQGQRPAEPFLDISNLVSETGSQGLLGLAFDPDYKTNGFFYVSYSNKNPHNVSIIARYKVSDTDPNKADPTSATILLSIEEPSHMHNVGDITFGPDGYLYIHSGDGGGVGDDHGPIGNGQSLDTLLGKILRIDVRNTNTADGLPYDIPASNPFVSDNDPATRGEIWAYGLRNPWRISFDRQTGDLYIADVGQEAEEEINFQPANSKGGENYGWRCMEGSEQYNWEEHCETRTFVDPIITYNHRDVEVPCSVTGGYVYRGNKHPWLVGSYIYGDFCSGEVWSAKKVGDAWQSQLLISTGMQMTTFGEDEAGELYLADFTSGNLYRFETANNFMYLPNTSIGLKNP